MDTLEKLSAIRRGLNRRFPDGNDPFQIMTCLLEEGGELAEHVNHLGKSVKREKHGALLTTTPGDTTMVTADQVRAFAKGGSARIQR